MITVGVVIWVAIVCVVIEGFFSGSEMALVSASKARLRVLAQSGHKGAQLAERFLAEPQKLLATTLLCTNIATVSFSVTVTLFLLNMKWSNGELAAVLMVTPTTLILGEVVPKTLFQQYADTLAPRVIYPLRAASFVLRPGVWLMSRFATAMTRLLGTTQKQAIITREELALLIDSEATNRSEITQEERDLIANVLESSELEATDVMVPLSEVTALPEDTTIAGAALEIADKQHSWIPIYAGRVDNIVGVLHVFDVLRANANEKKNLVSTVMRSVMFIPEQKPAVDLLQELKASKQHMSIVVDEYGGAIGVVTVEDIVEEIVGDIEDEYDAADPLPIRQLRQGIWAAEGKVAVHRVNQVLGLELPESDEYETLAGLILFHKKRIPNQGESLAIAGTVLIVTKVSARAVEEVQLSKQRRR